MVEKIIGMFYKLKNLFMGSKTPREITLLIIGPASSGKTALIYFIYQHVALRQRGVALRTISPAQPPTTKMIGSDKIKELDLSDFIKNVKSELGVIGDFVGTEPNSINYIHYDTGDLKLKIFNIAGEVFNWAVPSGEGRQREILLREFAGHLEAENIDNVYTILADECPVKLPEKQEGGKIDFTSMVQLFTPKEFPNTFNIFSNILSNRNTIRIVTKFDRKFKPTKNNTRRDEKANFDIMREALFLLNNNEDFLNLHQKVYELESDEFFEGSWKRMRYEKRFLCTGMYDVFDSEMDLYEYKPEQDRPGLKSIYTAAGRDGISRLRMYGIKEIFIYLLYNNRKYPLKLPVSNNAGQKNPFSVADYKKILKIK